MWLAAVRDVAIVLLAIESIVIGVLLAIIMVQIIRLVRLLREEIGPLLHTTQETLDSVKQTTNFVSHNVVDPVIQVSSYSAGVTETLRNLFAIRRRVKSRKPVVVETPSLEDARDR
ncbi:MAG: hypothetical protein GX552_01040 [Chloroflexi bacterium]|jgi:hypothetical protein|nr:hypothetical protein [Chloroflexota bacterium]